ncbi:sensor histidine kinase [Alicyclobacillaceae bacterium I2511]|nr:sensor histidine kinase [Alicyclobacillaceae bacterium I2511]
MFHNIRVRLTLWSALVFFVILILFSLSLYFNLKVRLYNSLDRQTLNQVHPMTQAVEAGHLPPPLLYGQGNPVSNATNLPNRFNSLGTSPGFSTQGLFARAPLGLILWNSDTGQILSGPLTGLDTTAQAQLSELARQRLTGTLNLQGHQMRVLNLALPATPSTHQALDLEILRNSDDIRDTLTQTRMMLLVGSLFGAALSVLAGYLLAGRSLIPVRRAWDKQVQFVADASHELRTPLATISAQAELLLRQPDATVSQQATTVSGILSEARRMNRLVTQLLTLARSGSNESLLDRRLHNLSDLTRTVTNQFLPLCEARDIQLQTTIQHSFQAWVDEERYRQMLLILLDNALKFSLPGSTITMAMNPVTARRVEVSVTDTGRGISAADLPHVFDRFYQGDKSRSSRGTGLGLSIAQWIAQAHAGQIYASSQEGKGSQFTVVLPCQSVS